jgi:hypothetical protein
MRKDFEKFPIIERIFKYLLFLVASRDDVIKGSFVFNSRLSGHGRG